MGGIPSELLFRRPDVRGAEADLKAAHLAHRGAGRTLSAHPAHRRGGTASAALSGLFGPGSFLITLVGGLTAPIFEGGRRARSRT